MRLLSRFCLIFFWLFATTGAFSQNVPVSGTAQPADKIAVFTAGMEKQPGFLTFYWDAKKGKIWLEISQFDTEFLYYPTLAQGVGSNDIGLDRGRLGQEHVVSFQRTGNKILMVEPNYNYRAISNDPLEKRAVAESFAQSVHAGFEVVAEEGNRTLVDLTPFLMQDAVGAVQAIAQTKQGNYKLDPARCALYLPRSKAFPQNTEFEVTITLSGDSPGSYLREVVPTATAVTMRQHHSFVQLPPLDGSYKPRAFDPRIGYGGIEYFDYATPVSQPIMKRYISRHRLQKKDPAAAMSEAVKPIVYYMDPGAPEPIRQALMDGIGWWNQAYEEAGFRDAFQVKLLPPDADPMDIRYNLVQWVHRSTRGWSYGASVIDPRTGEILKGKVTLGSLRVRQDYLIAQGLVGKFDTDTSHVDEMMQMSLARLRQLAAHEVGHTLGLPHNYLASTQAGVAQGKNGGQTAQFGRASVMDYPTMVAKLRGASGPGQTIDLSDAYAKNIGEYDKWSIRYGYTQFADGANEKQELDKIVQDMHRAGLSFLTDQDARPESSAHPQTHLWDNGQNAADELRRVMQVRQVALANFSEKKIPAGMPMTTLEEVLAPLFLFHRYQVEAAVKSVGGQIYTNALRGDGQTVTASVSAAEQNKALAALLETLDPVVLSLPDAALALIPPRAFRYDPNPREVFKRRTGMVFDALAPAETAANLTLRLLLNPERCARLVRQKAIDPTLPGLIDVLDKVRETIMKSPYLNQEGYRSEIARQTEKLLLDHLIRLATNKEADGRVRELTHETLLKIWNYYDRGSLSQNYNYRRWLVGQYLSQPDRVSGNITLAQPAPDGAPIDPGQEWLLDTECEWR